MDSASAKPGYSLIVNTHRMDMLVLPHTNSTTTALSHPLLKRRDDREESMMERKKKRLTG